MGSMVKPKAPTAKRDPDLAKLPAAMRDRAQALANVAHARIEREAKGALDEARAALEQAARGYYALGRALTVLRKKGYAEALGFAGGFRELYAQGLGLSRATVERLLSAVASLSAAEYARLRPARVDALLALASATPADDTREILAGKVVALWEGGPSLDVAKAKTAELRAAAVQVRDHVAAASGRRKGGKSASPEERALAREGADAFKAAGSKATAKTRATKPGSASVFDVMGLSADEFRLVLESLAKAPARRPR